MYALIGKQHVSRFEFSLTLATAYHECVLRHYDAFTAGGVVINTAPKIQALYQGILQIAEMNRKSHKDVNFVQQIEPYIYVYWTGAVIIGPTGIVNVTSPGSWVSIHIKQNFDFNVILYAFESAARIHLATLTGIYTSTVIQPPITTPWSGASLQTFP